MSDPDPRLAELLRRAPAPPNTLDAGHRQAVLAAARQAWFRQRARRRQHLVWLAAAAVLAAVIAGWTLRVLTEPAPMATTPVVARHDPPAAPPQERAADKGAIEQLRAVRDSAKAEKSAPAAMTGADSAPVLADADRGPARKGRAEAEGLGPAPLEARHAPAAAPGGGTRRPMAPPPAAALPAAPPAMAKAKPAEAPAEAEAGAEPMAIGAMAPAAAAATAAAPAPAAGDDAAPDPVRGRLAIARLVLAAAAAGQLGEADRRAAAQAALAGLAGLPGSEAADLRTRLGVLLRR